jgi:hypothetical protein
VADYIDKQGKPRKMIEFSEDVLTNVLGLCLRKRACLFAGGLGDLIASLALFPLWQVATTGLLSLLNPS